MSKNIYKIRKLSHLEGQLETNDLRPVILIFHNNIIENNKDYYDGFLGVLNDCSSIFTFLCIYIINIEKFDEKNKLFPENIEKTIITKMILHGKIYDEKTYEPNVFLSSISSVLKNYDNSFKNIILTHFNQHSTNSVKQSPTTICEEDQEENEEQEDANGDEEIEQLQATYKEIVKQKKAALLEKEKLLKAVNT